MTSPWSISVRTMGNRDLADFTISVSPEDDLKCLHDQIEAFTGLKACQQRLIYRGRLISGSGKDDNDGISENEAKVSDVTGLCDGQTIHLVPRIVEESSTNPSQTTNSDTASPTTASRDERPSSSSSAGAASFLAALLGLGSSADDDEEESGSIGQQLQRLRPTRVRARSRRPNHRLTESDLLIPDPGTMEPVRQSLLTMHSLLQAHQAPQLADRELMRKRCWFKGQWIDCRDTVNQWLEATIVDIVEPEDILPPELRQQECSRPRPIAMEPTSDAAVSANDLEGRLRLLLEPADSVDVQWNGMRQRANNDGVQLLLVHYNAWPHRWDEWIRSDSERIRPFRTRTRHPNNSSTASPTPQSSFGAAPSTNLKDDSEASDRSALLPELRRVMTVVNNMVEGSVELMDTCNSQENKEHLPWMSSSREQPEPTEKDDENGPELRRQLQTLVPLLDRLGRTLIDAAPHLASYAASLPESRPPEPLRLATPESNVHVVDEDSFYLSSDVDVDNGDNPDDHRVDKEKSSSATECNDEEAESSTTPLLSAEAQEEDDDDVVAGDEIDPDYYDYVNGIVNTTRGEVRSRGSRSSSDDTSNLLRAYLAAASLSSIASSDDNNDGEGGLQGLGRLLFQRDGNNGNGGGGIDIHIHAIVTGPGGMAVVGAGGGTGTGTANSNSGGSNRGTTTASTSSESGESDEAAPSGNDSTSDIQGVPSPPQPSVPTAQVAEIERILSPRVSPLDDEELGIFDELYSENPVPVDLHHLSSIEEADEVPPSTPARSSESGSDDEETRLSPVAREYRPPRSFTDPEMMVRPTIGRRNQSSPAIGSRRRGPVARFLRRALTRRFNPPNGPNPDSF